MIRTLENGLKLSPSIDGVDCLIFDSNQAELSINYAKEHGIKRIMISPVHGYKADSIKPILPLCDLVNELIIADEKINYDGLGEFHNLTLLGALDNKRDIIVLNNFPNLVTLNCSFTDRLKGLENSVKLKRLTISDYKSKVKDLSALPSLNNLEHLSLIKTDITTLQGVERYSNLKKLEIFSASKLETIAALQGLSNILEEIQIEQCKKIKNYEALGKVKSLTKIILSESGELKSLAFVKELPQLEFISFWGTNVLDGNIKYCEGINYVGFDNKKHYTHKSEQFKK